MKFIIAMILVERAVLGDRWISGVVLRLPMVYGPRDHHRTYEYLKRMDDNRPAILLEEHKAGFLCTRGYVENVAAAIALAAMHPGAEGRVFNVGEEPPLSEGEWVRRIAEVAGWSGQIVKAAAGKLPGHLREPLNWHSHLAMSTARIRDELGYAEPVRWQEGLRRTLAWERHEPPGSQHAARFDYQAEDACLRAVC
jgi:nucleoside-diphosphate-sugar epimerase